MEATINNTELSKFHEFMVLSAPDVVKAIRKNLFDSKPMSDPDNAFMMGFYEGCPVAVKIDGNEVEVSFPFVESTPLLSRAQKFFENYHFGTDIFTRVSAENVEYHQQVKATFHSRELKIFDL